MKSILFFAVMLFSAIGVAQSIEGDWYYNDNNCMQKLTIKGDTMLVYEDLPYTMSLDTILPVNMAFRILTPKKTGANKTSYTTQLIKGRELKDTEVAIFEVAGTMHNPMLLLNMVGKDNTGKPIAPPLKLVTRKEIEKYATLKDITQMDEKTFIIFANKVIILREEYNNSAFRSREYYISEIKYTLAGLGYNPLIRMHDLGSKLIDRFRENPNTKELVEKMGK